MADKPASGAKRFWKLASMTAEVGGRFAQSKMQELVQKKEAAEQLRKEMLDKNSEVIAKTLGELKGAVMKVGQMASITTDILPESLADALKILQKEAPPVDFSVIREQVESELGDTIVHLFSSFDEEAYAAASIGQVHRAQLHDGRDVVVKVQYPGVDKALASDLRHLKMSLKASGLLKIDPQSLDELFAELKARLEEELDYTKEAQNIEFFYQHYKDNELLIVPRFIPERSSARVLTLEHEAGDNLAEVQERNYSQETINQLGNLILETLAEQIFVLGVLHADPNPANFACREDGRLIVYDYGCVKRLLPEVVSAYADMLRSALRHDYTEVEASLIRLGARNLAGEPVPTAYYREWRDLFAEPFLAEEGYNFATTDIHLRAAKKVPQLLANYLSSFKPPAEIAFLDRTIGGHYGNLRAMGATCQVKQITDAFVINSNER